MENLTKTTDYGNSEPAAPDAEGHGTALPSTSSENPRDEKSAKTPVEALRPSGESKVGSLPTTPGLTTQAAGGALVAEFLDEDLCRRWILERLHPGDPRCHGCNELITDATTLRNFWSGKRCICKACEKCFKAVSGTMLQGTQLSFRAIFMLMVLIEIKAGGIDDRRIAELVDIHCDTVKLWITRFRILAK